VFNHFRVELPQIELDLPPIVLDAFTQAQVVSARFFNWAHLWMPFISKPKWEIQLTGPFSRPRTDVKLLLFAMKLLLWSPGCDRESRDPTTTDYLTIKTLLSRAESAGILSLEMLQATALLTIYEYSHAIYPAAYVSIGTCIRYSQALGIDKQRRQDIDADNFGLEEQEERRRVWWAIIILDRVISRSHTGPDPRPDDLLPVHDHEWDGGNISPKRIYQVSEPSCTEMGMFARLAQAAFLLGRVYRWKNHPTGDIEFDHAEKLQLEMSLRVLINLTYVEGSERLMLMCSQIALCFNALVTLHTEEDNLAVQAPGLCTTPTTSSASTGHCGVETPGVAAAGTLQSLWAVAQESSMNTILLYKQEPGLLEKSSPLLLHWTYNIAVTFIRVGNVMRANQELYPANSPQRQQISELLRESKEGLEVMKQKLLLVGKQWVAADAYMDILSARETANMS
jgi:hypothetical protein